MTRDDKGDIAKDASQIDDIPFVSVIIPVYNDEDSLVRCLECLAAQSYPQERLEAIIVDNGSDKSPRELTARFSFCRFEEEATPGSYAARNRALELARGEVLAFTDADCRPERDWIAAGVRALMEDPAAGFVGGKIVVFPADERNPTAVELFDMIFGLNQQSNVEETDFAATANMFTRRETFDKVGRFNELLKSGGDADWCQRATAMGFGGRFEEQAVVRHPARKGWKDLLRQTRRIVGGRVDRRRGASRALGLHFWKTLAKSVFPDVGRMARARRRLKQRGYGILGWVKVATVILFVQYARLWEHARKRLGAESERR